MLVRRRLQAPSCYERADDGAVVDTRLATIGTLPLAVALNLDEMVRDSLAVGGVGHAAEHAPPSAVPSSLAASL